MEQALHFPAESVQFLIEMQISNASQPLVHRMGTVLGKSGQTMLYVFH